MGLVMGICDSVKSFSGVLAPLFSGFIFENYGMAAPSYASAALTATALIVYSAAACSTKPVEKKKAE
jgi:hypothetical protein